MKPIVPARLMKAVAAGWNPADAVASQYVFTSGNKIATRIGASSAGGVRGVTSRSAGKLYFEIRCIVDDPVTNTYIGIASGAYPLTGIPYPPQTPPYVLYYNAGVIMTEAGVVATVSTHVAGDVCGFEVDFSASTVTVYRNNTSLATVSYTAGSSMFPFFYSYTNAVGASMELRTSAADQTYPTRSGGFVAWG